MRYSFIFFPIDFLVERESESDNYVENNIEKKELMGKIKHRTDKG